MVCPLLMRVFFHLGVLLIVMLSLRWNRLNPAWSSFSVKVDYPAMTPTVHPWTSASVPAGGGEIARPMDGYVSPDLPASEPAVAPALMDRLLQAPVPHTIVPERARKEVISYTVAAGDNLYLIAERFGLHPNTLIGANEELEEMPDLLYVGQVLTVLPVDGVYHTVKEGETLERIAQMYRVETLAILQCPWNRLESASPQIMPGQKLIVPGAVKELKPRYIRSFSSSVAAGGTDDPARNSTSGSGNFVWPVGGYISQGYWELHRAIDIAGDQGDVVVAADAGTVIYAQWDSNGYGYLVVIDHGNGFVSYYAHLYGFTIQVGDSVQRGQQIGARGTTGRSTGSHLHFEIRQNGVLRNPLAFLPGQ